MAGKIIALMAPTRSGKTFLARKLASHYEGRAILEAPEELPAWVSEALRDGTRPLASWVYFRDRGVQMQLEAAEIAQRGEHAFLDTTWLSNHPYIVYHGGDPVENALMTQISEIDMRTLPWPDALVILTIDDATTAKLWRSSNKSFERGDTYFQDRVLPLKRAFEKHLKDLALRCPAVQIDRSGLDWDDPTDFKRLTDQIDPIIND